MTDLKNAWRYCDESTGCVYCIADLGRIHGFAHIADDDTPMIIINSRDTREKQQDTAAHELEHIIRDDFRSLASADSIELLRHHAKAF